MSDKEDSNSKNKESKVSPSRSTSKREQPSPGLKSQISTVTSQNTKFAFNAPVINEKGARQINGIFSPSTIEEETWAVPVFL